MTKAERVGASDEMKLIACWRVDVRNAFWQTFELRSCFFLFFNYLGVKPALCEYVYVHMWFKPAVINSRRYFQRKFHLQEGRLESVHGHRRGARKKLRCDPANGP